jgi:hypothetical protein
MKKIPKNAKKGLDKSKSFCYNVKMHYIALWDMGELCPFWGKTLSKQGKNGRFKRRIPT